MKKILVPLDGSPSSKKAAELAIDTAVMSGGSIVVLRVIDVENYAGQWEFMRDKVEDELTRDANAILDDVEKQAKGRGVAAEKVIRYGDSSHEIIAYARENSDSVSSIIMGSAGRRGIARAFVGSTASRVVRQVGAEVACPVTVVPA